jgi:hypothetical protein
MVMIQNNSNMCGTTNERIFEVAGHRGAPKPKKTKEEIAKRQNEKITCECGSIVSKVNLPAHERSKKHLEMMETGLWNGPSYGRKMTYKPRERGRKNKTYKGVEVLTEEERRRRRNALRKSLVACSGCRTKVLYNSMWSHLRSSKHRDLMAAKKQPKHFIKKRKYKLMIV